MLSLTDLSPTLLEKWNDNTDIVVARISYDMTILDCSKNFIHYSKLFPNFGDLITFTHKTQFLTSLNECIENKSVVALLTNFYYEKDNLEDIPQSYKVTMQYVKEDEIILIAEPLPALSHDDAKTYFSMISDYSNTSRKLQKSQHELNSVNNDLKKKMKKIEHFANYDTLTNIYNRKRVFEELNKEYERFKRLHTTFSVVMIDIDDFKHVNDTYGHQSGDIVLIEFAATLKSMVREYDMLGRVGGEEFLILLPEANISMAKQSIQRMIEKVAKHSMRMTEGQILSVTFSAGVAEIDNTMSLNDLVGEADKQLYKAKEAGKNRVM